MITQTLQGRSGCLPQIDRILQSDGIWVPSQLEGIVYSGSHPNQVFENIHTGQKVLIKEGPEHTVRAELINQRYLELIGAPVAAMQISRSLDGKLYQIHEFLRSYHGSQSFPGHFADCAQVQLALGVDLINFQYDRYYLNFMYRGNDIVFIDHGASNGSSATGRAVGFPLEVDIQQIAECLTSALNSNSPANPAYASVIDWDKAQAGELLIKRPDIAALIIKQLRGISSEQIDRIIDEAFAGVSIEDMTQSLENRLKTVKGRSDYKSRLALATIDHILGEWDGNEREYMRYAHESRKLSLIKLLGAAMPNEANTIEPDLDLESQTLFVGNT